MAEHRTKVDEYGNPILRVDEYGNPIRNEPSVYGTAGGGTGGYGHGTGGGTGVGTGTGTGVGSAYPQEGVTGGTGAQYQPQRPKEGHGATGVLHRSGSSSSSSSEDDGMGGRRKKKSIKDKIKEKLPGTRKDETPMTGQHVYGATGGQGYGTGTTGTTAGAHGYGTGTTGTTAGTHGYGTGTTGTTATGEPEKKGIMEKIKEKLPGSH